MLFRSNVTQARLAMAHLQNQKRHSLTPFDLARFIRGQVDAGNSNATVAKRLGMNLTTVAHHLALLDLPPELDAALKSGRCTSPRTLHQLCKLHDKQPNQVLALIDGEAEITRAAVSALQRQRPNAVEGVSQNLSSKALISQANLLRLIYIHVVYLLFEHQ